MNEVDKIEFARIWSATWSLYDKAVNDDILSLSFEALRPYNIDQVRAGLTHHVQAVNGGQFAPRPADVIKHIYGNQNDQANQAWIQVDYAIRHVGAWNSVLFEDGLIAEVIYGLGGWVKLCKSNERLLEQISSRFIESYLHLQTTLCPANENVPLKGIIDNCNSKNAKSIKAIKIYQKGNHTHMKTVRVHPALVPITLDQ